MERSGVQGADGRCWLMNIREEGCNLNDFTGGGKVLEVGFRDRADARRELGTWTGRVASAYCQRIA